MEDLQDALDEQVFQKSGADRIASRLDLLHVGEGKGVPLVQCTHVWYNLVQSTTIVSLHFYSL